MVGETEDDGTGGVCLDDSRYQTVVGLIFDKSVTETFSFDGKLYGLVRSKDQPTFVMFVKVTRYPDGGMKWESLNETLENAVKYFYEKRKK